MVEEHKEERDVLDQYNLVIDRIDEVQSLSEEKIFAILKLHRDGVPLATIQEAYVLPLIVLNLIVADCEKGWETDWAKAKHVLD